MPKYVAIIQARLASQRLPGKVLEKIGRDSLIDHIVNRLNKIKIPFKFAIADELQDQLQNYLKKKKYPFIRGSEKNVLQRFLKAAEDLAANDWIIRITADNPFLDFQYLEHAVEILNLSENLDYFYFSGLPMGCGFELVRKGALCKIMEHPLQKHHEEHVTVFIRENPEYFQITKKQIDFNIPTEELSKLRITVDEDADLEFVRTLWEYFSKLKKDYFVSHDIVEAFKENPGLFKINEKVVQKSAFSFQK